VQQEEASKTWKYTHYQYFQPANFLTLAPHIQGKEQFKRGNTLNKKVIMHFSYNSHCYQPQMTTPFIVKLEQLCSSLSAFKVISIYRQ